ncbi:MAG: hypothetical protein NW216_02175 [Hyphomicrobium sp.]|nr:hypothetical protein [Hyphomicrobium sp.]
MFADVTRSLLPATNILQSAESVDRSIANRRSKPCVNLVAAFSNTKKTFAGFPMRLSAHGTIARAFF